MDYVIVIFIVMLAFLYLIRRYLNNIKKGVSCGCDAFPSGCIAKESGNIKKDVPEKLKQ